MLADQVGQAIQAQAQYKTELNRIGGIYSPHSTAPLAQMEKRQAEIEQEHAKRLEGIQFLRDNPQFDKFIELIRKGSISI